MENEVWLPVVGYESSYSVSNLGRIKSLDRYLPSSYGKVQLKKGMILRQSRTTHGYLKVELSFNGLKKSKRSHRLVAEAFIPNHFRKEQVNHINGIKDDNGVENLEWCTQQENIIHALANNLMKLNPGEQHPKAKLNWETVKEIRIRLENGELPIALSHDYKLCLATIYNVKSQKYWRTI
jgi:hypothetical protein